MEKIFLIEGEEFTLNQFLFANTDRGCAPIDEEHLLKVLKLEVGESAEDHNPHYPVVKRVK